METDLLLMQVLVELRTTNRYLDLLIEFALAEAEKDKEFLPSKFSKFRKEYMGARLNPVSARWTYP